MFLKPEYIRRDIHQLSTWTGGSGYNVRTHLHQNAFHCKVEDLALARAEAEAFAEIKAVEEAFMPLVKTLSGRVDTLLGEPLVRGNEVYWFVGSEVRGQPPFERNAYPIEGLTPLTEEAVVMLMSGKIER